MNEQPEAAAHTADPVSSRMTESQRRHGRPRSTRRREIARVAPDLPRPVPTHRRPRRLQNRCHPRRNSRARSCRPPDQLHPQPAFSTRGLYVTLVASLGTIPRLHKAEVMAQAANLLATEETERHRRPKTNVAINRRRDGTASKPDSTLTQGGGLTLPPRDLLLVGDEVCGLLPAPAATEQAKKRSGPHARPGWYAA
jgi:hypothetical protein